MHHWSLIDASPRPHDFRKSTTSRPRECFMIHLLSFAVWYISIDSGVFRFEFWFNASPIAKDTKMLYLSKKEIWHFRPKSPGILTFCVYSRVHGEFWTFNPALRKIWMLKPKVRKLLWDSGILDLYPDLVNLWFGDTQQRKHSEPVRLTHFFEELPRPILLNLKLRCLFGGILPASSVTLS